MVISHEMAEHADKSEEHLISEFIVDTCQTLPKLYDGVLDRIKSDNGYGVYCGSSIEIFIRPFNACVDDVDQLIYFDHELAFEENFPVLPLDVSVLSDMIKCYKIEPDKRYPGFVQLRHFGKFIYNWKCKKYDFIITTINRHHAVYEHFIRCPYLHVCPIAAYIGLDKACCIDENERVCGPAVNRPMPDVPSKDTVTSIWCPKWPNQAKEWPKRPRKQGWPTISTISEVIQNGCHIVHAQHRSCRGDDLQWRFSFSVAEVILLQSWTKIQQIVYHLLRFFAKRVLIRKDCPKKEEVLCVYHLKILMLWTCEEMASEWWNTYSVITICSELLQKLSEWLNRKYCPNYFIPEANLFHDPPNFKLLELNYKICEFRNSGTLSQWFVENYILPFAHDNFRFKIENTEDLEGFRKCILSWRKEFRSCAVMLDSMYTCGFLFCHNYACCTFKYRRGSEALTSFRDTRRRRNNVLSRNSPSLSQPIPKNDHFLTVFDTALYSLTAACILERGIISWDSELFVNYAKEFAFETKIVKCQFQTYPKPFTGEGSLLHYLTAQEFLENLTGSDSASKVRIIFLMSKEFFKRALECDDSSSCSIVPATLIHLAAIHFATLDFQIAIDLCSAVLIDDTSHGKSETINGGCLFFIEDVVKIAGFCLLFKQINDKKLFHGNKVYLDLRVTPKVFAYYLTVICASRKSKQFELNLPKASFPFDQYLLVLTKRIDCISINSNAVTCFKTSKQCSYRRVNSLIACQSMNPVVFKETIVEGLREYAVEFMTKFYNTIDKDFDIQCNTAVCYRALYLYKSGKYDEVIHLCEQILLEPDVQHDLKELGFAHVLIVHPLDSLFDNDVQSLFGFQALCSCLSPVGSVDFKSGKFKSRCDLKFEDVFVEDGLTSEAPPIPHFSIKCHCFLRYHFLARYLKLRCLIDCDQQSAEAIYEFTATKSNLPFEHIIRRFIQQKLRMLKTKLL